MTSWRMPRVGDVMCADDFRVDPIPPRPAIEFTALVFVHKCCHKVQKKQKYKREYGYGMREALFNQPIYFGGAAYRRHRKREPTPEYYITGGFTPTVYVRTTMAPCKMIEIKWKMGKSTSNQKIQFEQEDPLIEDIPYIEQGDQAEIVFKPQKGFVVLPFDQCKPYGRIAVVDNNELVMIGKVTKVMYD